MILFDEKCDMNKVFGEKFTLYFAIKNDRFRVSSRVGLIISCVNPSRVAGLVRQVAVRRSLAGIKNI